MNGNPIAVPAFIRKPDPPKRPTVHGKWAYQPWCNCSGCDYHRKTGGKPIEKSL